MGVQNKEMITLNDLRMCYNCGNIFSKMIGSKVTNRCPACNVWKKEKDNRIDLGKHINLKKFLHKFLHHNIEKKHYW